jgi:hypothetical protein
MDVTTQLTTSSWAVNLSFAVIAKEQSQMVQQFINYYKEFLRKCSLIVVDSQGAEALKSHATVYIKKFLPLDQARSLAISKLETPYALMVDVDTHLPHNYIKEAYTLLLKEADVVAIDYNPPQGHLAFGASMWKTEVLKKLYDWRMGSKHCECIHMWNRIHQNKLKLATLPYTARHNKHEPLH